MSSMVMDGVMPRSRKSDPVTSVDAGRAADLEGSQRYVLYLLHTRGAMADFEMETEALGEERPRLAAGLPAWSFQRLRSARAELVELGCVAPIEGEFRRTKSGRRAQVWAAIVPPTE